MAEQAREYMTECTWAIMNEFWGSDFSNLRGGHEPKLLFLVNLPAASGISRRPIANPAVRPTLVFSPSSQPTHPSSSSPTTPFQRILSPRTVAQDRNFQVIVDTSSLTWTDSGAPRQGHSRHVSHTKFIQCHPCWPPRTAC